MKRKGRSQSASNRAVSQASLGDAGPRLAARGCARRWALWAALGAFRALPLVTTQMPGCTEQRTATVGCRAVHPGAEQARNLVLFCRFLPLSTRLALLFGAVRVTTPTNSANMEVFRWHKRSSCAYATYTLRPYSLETLYWRTTALSTR